MDSMKVASGPRVYQPDPGMDAVKSPTAYYPPEVISVLEEACARLTEMNQQSVARRDQLMREINLCNDVIDRSQTTLNHLHEQIESYKAGLTPTIAPPQSYHPLSR